MANHSEFVTAGCVAGVAFLTGPRLKGLPANTMPSAEADIGIVVC